MERAYFYRKAKNIKEYDNVILKYKEYTDFLSFKISKKILLNKKQYKNFTNNFMEEQDFIKQNIDLMTMDDNDVVSCLLMHSENYNFGILVYSAGYGYARYIAKITI